MIIILIPGGHRARPGTSRAGGAATRGNPTTEESLG